MRVLFITILFFSALFAQMIEISGDAEASICFRVRMVSLGYSIAAGGDGADRTPTAPLLSWSLVEDTFEVSDTLSVNPCDFLHYVFWTENLGAAIMGFDVWDMEISTSWYKDSFMLATNNCSDLVDTIYSTFGRNKYASSYEFVSSDGDALTPGAGLVGWIPLPIDGVGIVSEEAEIWGEDPSSLGDGGWTTQIDQRELHIGILCPYSVTDTICQSIMIAIVGNISR